MAKRETSALLYPIVLPGDDVPGNMTFGPTWSNLLENIDALQPTATLITPLSRKAFAVEDVQEHRVLIQYRDDDETIPLQKAQFETLYERVSDSHGEFNLDRLPPDAEPYATVL